MFTNWSGDLSGSDNPTTLTMDSPRSVTANFSVAAIYVDGASGQDTNDGLTWETAVKTIQTGLDKAANGWTVLVANGTYTGTGNKNLDFNGKAIHLVSVGGAENCIIDCQDSGRGFYFGQGEDADSVVEGFTIRNGVAGYGGAVYCCNSSSPAITNCTFSGNSASDGGAVYCWNHSSLTITNCTLSGNSAASGGAVGCWDSGPTITNCTLSGNLAGDDGGAVYCDYLSISTITNCTLSGNLAGDAGGAVYCDYSSPTITNCAFSKNSADWSGGAVYCCDSSSPTITNSTFSGNLAPQGYGGAVYCCNSSSPAITNCTFSGNSASDGGAVNCAYNCRSTITNCTLSGNLASEYGGGVCCCSYARPAITNSILWSNSATLSGNEIYIYDSPSSVMLNNSDVTPGGYGGATGNITENNCIHSDPLFLDAANSDYHLQAGSPCIDAGDNSLVPEGITTDLDGNPRIQNGTVDIGAYEYQP
jgi:predicted outer membrane repeat protein